MRWRKHSGGLCSKLRGMWHRHEARLHSLADVFVLKEVLRGGRNLVCLHWWCARRCKENDSGFWIQPGARCHVPYIALTFQSKQAEISLEKELLRKNARQALLGQAV